MASLLGLNVYFIEKYTCVRGFGLESSVYLFLKFICITAKVHFRKKREKRKEGNQ